MSIPSAADIEKWGLGYVYFPDSYGPSPWYCDLPHRSTRLMIKGIGMRVYRRIRDVMDGHYIRSSIEMSIGQICPYQFIWAYQDQSINVEL